MCTPIKTHILLVVHNECVPLLKTTLLIEVNIMCTPIKNPLYIYIWITRSLGMSLTLKRHYLIGVYPTTNMSEKKTKWRTKNMKNIFLGDRHKPETLEQPPCKECKHRGDNNKCWSCSRPAIYYNNFEQKDGEE